MPPDPAGVWRESPPVVEPSVASVAVDDPTRDRYDRSSMPRDLMVMIPDQTEADYFRRDEDCFRFCEFIDGTVYMPPNVRMGHQEDTQFLLCLLSCYHARRPIGIISTGPVAIKLREGCILEPDVFVLPPGTREHITGEGYCVPPVLLVIEVLSPGNRSHDLIRKRALYREANIAEIWFVDGRDRVLIVDRPGADGYTTERVEAGPFACRSVPGFWLDVSWLWARPEPNLLDCLDQILAGFPEPQA